MLVIGDNNCPEGNEHDSKLLFIKNHKCEWETIARQRNQDCVVNKQGEALLQMVRDSDTLLLLGVFDHVGLIISCAVKGAIHDHTHSNDMRNRLLEQCATRKKAWQMCPHALHDFDVAPKLHRTTGRFYDTCTAITTAAEKVNNATSRTEAQRAIDDWLEAIEHNAPYAKWKSKGEWSTDIRSTHHNNATTSKSPALREALRHFRRCQRRWTSSLQAADDDATNTLFLDMLEARRVIEKVRRTEHKRQNIEKGKTLQKMLDNKGACWWIVFRRNDQRHDTPLNSDMANIVETGLHQIGTIGFPCNEQMFPLQNPQTHLLAIDHLVTQRKTNRHGASVLQRRPSTHKVIPGAGPLSCNASDLRR